MNRFHVSWAARGVGTEDEVPERLTFETGVNVLVGLSDTGKTSWLRLISYVLGHTRSASQALGRGLASKYSWGEVGLLRNDGEEFVLRRTWKVPGLASKISWGSVIFEAEDFPNWLAIHFDLPVTKFPSGNPYSGASWSQLSWESLFRHIHRGERSWDDLAPKQPPREKAAVLLQFFGVAEKAFPPAIARAADLARQVERETVRAEEFRKIVKNASAHLLDGPTEDEALLDSIQQKIAELEGEIAVALRQPTRDSQENPTPPSEVTLHRAKLVRELEELDERLERETDRLSEIKAYQQRVEDELGRIERAHLANKVLAPLAVKTCPHCDQVVDPKRAQPGHCFVCCQSLPQAPNQGALGAEGRILFEKRQLVAECRELTELVESLISSTNSLAGRRHSIAREISAIQSSLAVDRSFPGALEATTRAVQVGQLQERVEQLRRFSQAVSTAQHAENGIQELKSQLNDEPAREQEPDDVPFAEMSAMLSGGMNEYVRILNAEDPTRWTHPDVQVRFRINDVSLLVAGRPAYDEVGASSFGVLLLAYHYALLKLAPKEAPNQPGLAILDFPLNFSPSVGSTNDESYLLQPFVALCESGLQLIACGHSFSALEGAHRQELTHVWASTTKKGSVQLEAGTFGDLTANVNYHSGQKQIVVVLDRASTRRLGDVLSDLGSAISDGEKWRGPPLEVVVGGASFQAQMGYNHKNGAAKFTVPRSQKKLWSHLDRVLRENPPPHSYSARYQIVPDGIDRLVINLRIE